MKDKSHLSLNFFGGENGNFVHACNLLSFNEDNNEFISFLCSDMGQNIMTNNSFRHMLKVETYFTTTSTQKKIFTTFC